MRVTSKIAYVVGGLLLCVELSLSALGAGNVHAGHAATQPKEGRAVSLTITSSAFTEGQPIPQRFTCQGDDISPPLAIAGSPDGTKSIALIMDDPDAPIGTWLHWVLYNLPGDASDVSEQIPPGARLPDGAMHGKNSWGKMAYGGPCPPPGGPHRYFFKFYALDAMLDLAPGATKKDLLAAMEGHILAEGQLMGTYQRQ